MRNIYISAALVFGAILVLVLGYAFAYRSSERTVVLVVEDKEGVVVSSGSGESRTTENQYRVYTDQGVFIVADSFVYLNFRAADRYASLKVGQRYTCKTAGWRVGLISWFPNLIKCKEVT